MHSLSFAQNQMSFPSQHGNHVPKHFSCGRQKIFNHSMNHLKHPKLDI